MQVGSPVTTDSQPFLSIGCRNTDGGVSRIFLGQNAAATSQESLIEYSRNNDALSIYKKQMGSYTEHVRFGNVGSSGTARTRFYGNVGIGANPSQKLEVVGAAKLHGNLIFDDSYNVVGGDTIEIQTGGSTKIVIDSSDGGILMDSGSGGLESDTFKSNFGDNVFTGNVKATVFYDYSNNGYYLDPASTSVALNISGRIAQLKEDYNIDSAFANSIYQAVRANETNRGTWPTSYMYGVNFGDRTKGIQLASRYSGANALYFRSGTDNSSSENGANAWKNWRQLFHDDYHPEADTLTTARTIAGSSFDGSANIDISYNNLTNKPTIPTNYLRDDAFDSGIGLYLQGGSFNAGTDTATSPLVIDEEDFILTKDGGYLRRLIGKTSDQIQIGQGGTSLISSINFIPGTAGNSAVKINNNTIWNAGNDGAGSGLDADLLDGQHGSYYALKDHFRHTGTGYYTSTTTSALLSEALGDDAFDSGLSAHKTGWSYAGNGNLTDAGRLTELAGTSWLWWTDNFNDNVQGNVTALCIAPTTGGSAGKMFVYNNQGSTYSPGWREIWTSTSDGSGSGLDADLLDGAQGSSYLRSDASDTFNAGNGGLFEVQGVFKVSNPSATSQAVTISNASSGGNTYISNGNGNTIFFGVPNLNTTNIEVQGSALAALFRGRFNSNFYTNHESTSDSIRVAGDIVAFYSSDRRYKENIKPIESPIEKVKAISGVTFEWNEKSHKETGKKDIGVIAQEVEEVLPEIVETRSNGYKAVDYQKLTAVLIEAVKDQQKQIDELKSIINGSS